MSAVFDPEDSARFLAAMVESSDDAIIGKDLEGRILTWNHGAEVLYGYTPAQIVGQSVAILIPEDRRGELESVLSRIRGGLRVERYETTRRRRDGTLVDVALTISPVFDAGGVVIGAATIARDVSARKNDELNLRRSEARWRAVVQSAVDAIIAIDGEGRIEAFNPAAERMFGYTEAEVRGRNVKLLMPPPYKDEHDRYVERYIATREAHIIGIGREVTGLRRDGSTFPLQLSVGEVEVEGERRFTGILHDLTSRVRIEEQLREQTALARLGEMAAVLAHEIKNPLAGIRGAIQVISSRMPADSREARIMHEIVARVDGLNQLTKDLLLFARPPKPSPAPVDLKALVSTTVDLLHDDPAVREVGVHVEGSAPTIMADAELLKIVFVNLIVNAAHATEGRGTITVAISGGSGMCRVAVQDSGPGIPADIRARIFTPFFTTKSRGSGLGLPTAKRLVEAHAGRIDIECPPGGGTTVNVQLPA